MTESAQGPLPLRRVDRTEWEAPPERIVHLGLGAFFRAHQVDYTARAHDASQWGITAFSGRSADLAHRLTAQQGLYTLTTKDAVGENCRVVPNLVRALSGADRDAWTSAMASPHVEVLTLTVTEDAYVSGPRSIAPRLLDGLDARRRAPAGPITIIPCDNLPNNAAVLKDLLVSHASQSDAPLAEWIGESVRFVGSVVDRITPAATDDAKGAAKRAGWIDAAPVVTEPFCEWVLSGTFAGDHPDWGSAGARFVDDLIPYSERKLLLLNGAHTLIAHLGLLRGYATVSEAFRDDAVRGAVNVWWAQATRSIDLGSEELSQYIDALCERFTNPAIAHQLAQIARDASRKLAVRVVPVALSERRARRSGDAAALQLGAWVAWVRRRDRRYVDAQAIDVRAAASGKLADATRRLIALLCVELADDDPFCRSVVDCVRALEAAEATHVRLPSE